MSEKPSDPYTKDTYDAPQQYSSTTSTRSMSQINASPRFVKPVPPSPIPDSDVFSDAESVLSKMSVLDVTSAKPQSPSSVLSQEDSDDLKVDVATFEESMYHIEPPRPPRNIKVQRTTGEPQLIMPTVKLPSKRPFTENGIKLGKLRILVAGDSGVGKSALIQAIAKVNQDIVHVDEPVRATLDDRTNHEEQCIWEINASTKPLPLFWLNDKMQTHSQSAGVGGDDSMSSAQTERRPSLIHSSSSVGSSEIALDRNLCFIDTSGYGDADVDYVIDYMDQQFRHTAQLVNPSSPQSQVLSILTSSLSSELVHVDVCFYLIQDRLKRDDLEYMTKIKRYCPIIPLVAKSDLQTPTGILDLKVAILKGMTSAGVIPFLFDTQPVDAIKCGEALQAQPRMSSPNGETDDDDSFLHPLLFPCSVSGTEKDTEMDASVLMSPDYLPSLAPSQLEKLCSYVFSDQGSAWLRYIAAKRFIDWHVSYHVSNALTYPVGFPSSAAITSTRHSSQALVHVKNPEEEEYIINLPSSMFVKTKAQQHTARWAMRIEQATRSENNYALRQRPRKRSQDVRKGSSNSDASTAVSRRQPKVSHSILNVDPLDLRGVSSRCVRCLVKALGVLLSVRLATLIYSKTLSDSSMPVDEFGSCAGGSMSILNNLKWPLLN